MKPVCLPNQPGPSYDNVLATVSGWGTLQSGGFQADKLREVNVTTMTNAECNVKYSGEVLDSMICAADKGKDACQGDSGGKCIVLVFMLLHILSRRPLDNSRTRTVLCHHWSCFLGIWLRRP